MIQIIKNQLLQLNPIYIEVINDSHLHLKGENTHFKLIIVSRKFDGLAKVKRHQLIYSLLGNTMHEIHALTINAFSQNEWLTNTKIKNTPNCLGGGLLE